MAQPVEKIIAGKYEILDKIREGGMGAIYKVRHRLLDEVRIVKVLRSDLAMDEKLRLRFQNEAKFAIQLRHPNIAHLYDFSVSADGTSAYIVMEFIDGVTLQELIAESGPPTLGLAVEIATQALQALGYLHQQGFVHRDIASDNLMLTKDFEGAPLVKLIDLGIAKGQDQKLNLTATGMFMGKVRYSAPELFKAEGGAASLDERSDLYSFGILLYELLTGKSPVTGESFSEIVAGHLFRAPLPFETSDPDGRVPEGLRALTLSALEKDPDKRISTAAELLERLAEFSNRRQSHAEEFARAIEATAQLATLKPRSSAGVSTQGRLDEEFGIDDPSSHPSEIDEAAGEAVAEAASAIRERTRLGELAKASEDLDLAVSLYGEHPEFQTLRSELRAAPDAGGSPSEVERPAGVPAPQAASGGLSGRLKSPLAIAVGAALLLAALAALLGGGLFSGANGAPETDGGALLVERAPRWSADPGPVTFGGPPSLADDPSVAVPPPVPGAPEDAAAASPPRPAPDPGATAPETEPETETEPVEPAAPVPAPAEEGEAAASTPSPEVRPGQLFGPVAGVTPPTLIQVPAPVYPAGFDPPNEPIALQVKVLVSEEGQVLTALLAPGESAKKRFRQLAVETAKGATFRPATKQGVPGKYWTIIRVTLPPG